MRDQFIYINEYGTKRHYSDREMRIFHCENGPAIAMADGHKEWYINGKRHREDGPAFEYTNGYKEWYINGKRLTEEEFNTRMNPVELTLDEIAEKFGVSVDKLKIKR